MADDAAPAPAPTSRRMTRRQVVGAVALATAGAAAVGRTPVSSLFAPDSAAAAACVSLTPEKTIGPYFVEEGLERSDITTDPATGTRSAGVPLRLDWTLVDEDAGCAPLVGAQVDVWHADAGGLYSDEAGEGTAGVKNLRGHQITDANGRVAFTTIYPGWYRGRTVHIHVRIRIRDASGAVVYDFVTQVFFDDALTDQVYAVAPYAARGARDTRNAADRIYGSDVPTVQLALSGSTSAGYSGSFTFGLSAGGRSGSATPSSGTTTPSSGAVDAAVGMTITQARFTRTPLGTRVLLVRVRTTEALALDVRLLRGTRTVRHQATNRRAGTHLVKVAVGRTVPGGRVVLDVTGTDTARNRKVVTKRLRIPPRGVG